MGIINKPIFVRACLLAKVIREQTRSYKIGSFNIFLQKT